MEKFQPRSFGKFPQTLQGTGGGWTDNGKDEDQATEQGEYDDRPFHGRILQSAGCVARKGMRQRRGT